MIDPIEQIRRAHLSARPKAANPAWMNTHAQIDVLLVEIDSLRATLREADCPYPIENDNGSVGACVDNDHCGCSLGLPLNYYRRVTMPQPPTSEELQDARKRNDTGTA